MNSSKRSSILRTLPVVLLLVMAAALTMTAGEPTADMRKADRYFMEAMRQNALGNRDAYYSLLRRSAELDTANTDVSYLTGFVQALITNGDSALITQAYRMVQRHFEDQPDDIYAGNIFASINAHLGRNDMVKRIWHTLDSLHPNRTEIALNYADALAANADSADRVEAIKVYDRIETAEGKSAQLSSRKVTAMLQLADTAGVIRELDELLAATPHSAQSRVFAGTVYSVLGRGDDAIKYYNEACEVDSTSGMAYYARANYYKETGDMQRYDSEVFRALKQESLDLETKMQLLTSYVRQQYADSTQQPRIEELFRVLIDQNPHDAEIRDLFSSYYYAIKNFDGAAEQLSYAIDIDPADEQRWRMLMGLYGQLQKWDEAVATGERAMHYHPSSPMVMMVTGIDYGMQKNYPKALELLKQALEATDSTDTGMQADVLTSLGDMYHQTEQPDSSYMYYDRALAIDPGNLLALNNYAYYLACEGSDLDKAQSMIAKVIAAKPSDPTSLDTYAWVMFKQKDYAKAKEFIDLALANDAEPGEEILHHAGDIYFMTGDPDKAVELWERALKLDPDNELLKRKVTNRAYYYN